MGKFFIDKKTLRDQARAVVEEGLRQRGYLPRWERRLEALAPPLPQALLDLPQEGHIIIVEPGRLDIVLRQWFIHFKKYDKENVWKFHFSYDKYSKVLRLFNSDYVRGKHVLLD